MGNEIVTKLIQQGPFCTAIVNLFFQKSKLQLTSGSRKRGVGFKGGSLHDGFGGFDSFGGSGKHLALLLLLLQIQCQEAAVTVLTVSAVVAVSVVTATLLNSTPLFRDPDNRKFAENQQISLVARCMRTPEESRTVRLTNSGGNLT